MKKNHRHGFTLIELSIVLVIIGLIIGGVLAGQELVNQAKIRNTITTISNSITAVQAFKTKYSANSIPGDFKNASAFGIDKDNAGNLDVALFSSSPNNDGNGNGVLEAAPSAVASYFEGEIANFWVHLSNAGLIKPVTQVSGCVDSGTVCLATPGETIPKLAVGNGLIAITNVTDNYLYFIAGLPTTMTGLAGFEGSGMFGDSLSPAQAFSIDSKIDDGRPDRGNVTVAGIYSTVGNLVGDGSLSATDCFTTVGGEYNVSLEKEVCTLGIKLSRY